jgi:aspartyl-tRNA(Asn)/glutamyl-tRNA(Gln) amidotransferase subunit A
VKDLHAGVRGLRLGVIRALHAFDDAETMAAFAQTLTVLRDLGADLVEVDVEPPQSAFVQCMRLINMSECFAIHRQDLRERRREMGPALRNKLLGGALVSASDYIDAQRARRKLTAALDRAIQPFHAVLLPTAPPAPRLDEPQAIADMTTLGATAPFNLSGHPALSLCNGFTALGLPTSVQIVSRHFAEADLLRVAVAYETATAWRSRRARCAPASQLRTPLAAEPGPPEADRALALELAKAAGLEAVTENDLYLLLSQRRRIDGIAATMRANLIPEDEPAWT